jgi:hypothetical protein
MVCVLTHNYTSKKFFDTDIYKGTRGSNTTVDVTRMLRKLGWSVFRGLQTHRSSAVLASCRLIQKENRWFRKQFNGD